MKIMNFDRFIIWVIYILLIAAIIFISIIISNLRINKLFKVIEQMVDNKENIKNIHINEKRKSYYFIKRLYDIVFSVLGLLILLPILLVVTVMIKIEGSGSIFVKDIRVGRFTRDVKIFRFRTKCDDKYTKVGMFLYKTSIADIPMLINVMLGDISVVGIYLYRREWLDIVEDKSIFSEKPGIVSLWALSIDKQRFKANNIYYFDKVYLNRRSILFDFYIIINTFKVALSVSGDY